jgi:hypothetical protein
MQNARYADLRAGHPIEHDVWSYRDRPNANENLIAGSSQIGFIDESIAQGLNLKEMLVCLLGRPRTCAIQPNGYQIIVGFRRSGDATFTLAHTRGGHV